MNTAVDVALWVVAGLLAVGFLASGVKKLSRSREELAAAGWGWAEHVHPGAIRAIGVLEVMAAVGLVLPAALGIAPVLVPVAAVGLVLLMVGAIVTHAGRREARPIVVNVVLLGMAAFVAWGRLGLQPFTG